MRLLWALFRWLFSRIFILLCIAGLVVLAALLNDWWKQRQEQETHLRTLQTQLGELHQKIREIRNDLTLEKRYLSLRQQEPSKWFAPLQWYRWNKELEALGALIDKKNAELKNLREQRDKLVREIETSSRALYETQEVFSSTLRKSLKTIVIVGSILFLGPFCWRAFWYFIIAALAGHARPVLLEKPSGVAGKIAIQESRKNHPVPLLPGDILLTRMAWLHQYTPSVRKKTRFLLNWRAPFISYAAGLSELTEVTSQGSTTPIEVVLSSAENPDTYLCEVQLDDHPGVAVYPSQVVAIVGPIQMKTRWTFMNLHSWIAGRLRTIIFSGTGRLYIKGMAGVEPVRINGQPVRLSESVLIAFETTVAFSTVRTETFWPYYRRLTPLFDYQFEGDGIILRQTAPDSKRVDSGPIRIFDTLMNGVGKLLGL